METSLAQLWQELLKLDRVGRHDDFFDLGGHSLLAVQLVSRIAQGLSRPVSVRRCLRAPQALGSWRRLLGLLQTQEALPIGAADRSRPLAASIAQQALWFLTQLDERASRAYHLSCSLRLQGSVGSRGSSSGARWDRGAARERAYALPVVGRRGTPEHRSSGGGLFARGAQCRRERARTCAAA